MDEYAPLPPPTAVRRLPLEPREWWVRPLSYALLAVIVGFVVWLLRPVLTPIAAAMAAAYAVSPLIDALERRRVPRVVTILALLAGFLALLAGLVAVVVPLVHAEVASLADNLPGYWERANALFLERVRPFVEERFGTTIPTTPRDVWNEAAARLSGEAAPDVAGTVLRFLRGTVSNVFGLLGLVLGAILFPVFFFYVAKDFPRIVRAAVEAIPPRNRDEVLARVREVDAVIASFVRGQITVCLLLAMSYSVGLSIIGIDLAVVIGVVSGLAFVIPYVGTIVGIVAASAMSIAEFGLVDREFALWVEPHLLAVLAMFAGVQLIESNVVTPKIVGDRVGLHPVVMITAVIVGGQLFGFLGVLLAIPATAAGAVFFRAGLERYRTSEFYRAMR